MRRGGWILWAFVIAGALLCNVGCAHVSAKQAPAVAQHALAKVGVAYQALAVAYRVAVELRVEHCKAKLGAAATEPQRIECMGVLGSEGEITTQMIRATQVYDEAADALGELAILLEQLERTLPKAGTP